MAPERVKTEFLKHGINKCRYLRPMKGWHMWAPVFGSLEMQYSGPPSFVLDDGEHARCSAPNDGFTIIKHFQQLKCR